MEVWTTIILPIISGIISCIPLVIKLIDVTRKNVKEQNWTVLMQLVLKFMAEAESSYETGAERKQYVLNNIKAIESTLNYNVDIDKIGAMIDSIVEASKRINIEKK